MTLTDGARRHALNRVAAPVIVEAEEGEFSNVAAEVRKLDLFELAGQKFRGDIKDMLNAGTPSTSPLEAMRPGVLFPKGGQEEVRDRFGPIGPVERKEIGRFNMVASFLDRDSIHELADNSKVTKIYADRIQHALFSKVPKENIYTYNAKGTELSFTDLRATRRLIGADVANDMGYLGNGVTVTVPDTAGLHRHPMTENAQFLSAMNQQADKNGHGVWCSACVFGDEWVNRRLSRDVNGQVVNEGMAPEADGFGIKCLGYVAGFGNTSDILKAIDMSIQQDAAVMSMSLGGPVDNENPKDSPYYKPMEEFLSQGGIPVIAAGNSGPKPKTVGSPGYLPNVLTIGAYDPRSGDIAEFSSRGPTPDGRVKPDVVAPGVKTDSASTGMLEGASDRTVSQSAPISGTSMATPHVAGLLTLATQLYREELKKDLTMTEVKDMMRALGDEKDNTAGWGAITWDMFMEWVATEYGMDFGSRGPAEDENAAEGGDGNGGNTGNGGTGGQSSVF